MIRLIVRRQAAQRQQDMTGQPPAPGGEPGAAAAAGPTAAPGPAAALIAPAAASIAFAMLTLWIARRAPSVPGVDEQIHRWVVANRDPASVRIANAVRWGGFSWLDLPAVFLVGAAAGMPGDGVRRRGRSAIMLCLIASAGVFTETQINAVIGRARPPVADWAGVAGGPSFPSGHTTTATLFAISCAWVLAARLPPGWPRRAIWAAAAVYAATVGWSRVWLGVHWPTDVLGGWLFGVAWMFGSIAVVRTFQQRRAAS